MHRPSFKKVVNTNEKFMTFILFVGPVMTIPQAYNVWFGSKDGVSIISWSTYFITQIFWLLHAFKMKDKVNIYSGFLLLVIEFVIIAGLILK